VGMQLLVRTGPDEGQNLELPAGGEIRVGRGPGHQLMITDPAWEGQLRIYKDQGVWMIRNLMPTSIYLGEATLGTGQEATWFTGTTCYATRSTALELQVEDTVPLEAQPTERGRRRAPRGPANPTASKPADNNAWLSIGIIVLAVPIVVFAFVFDQGPSDDATARRPYTQAMLIERLERHIQAQEDRNAQGILQDFRAAQLAEVSQHPQEAYARYRALRATLERDQLTKHPDAKETYNALRDWISDRMVALNREVRPPRR